MCIYIDLLLYQIVIPVYISVYYSIMYLLLYSYLSSCYYIETVLYSLLMFENRQRLICA